MIKWAALSAKKKSRTCRKSTILWNNFSAILDLGLRELIAQFIALNEWGGSTAGRRVCHSSASCDDACGSTRLRLPQVCLPPNTPLQNRVTYNGNGKNEKNEATSHIRPVGQRRMHPPAGHSTGQCPRPSPRIIFVHFFFLGGTANKSNNNSGISISTTWATADAVLYIICNFYLGFAKKTTAQKMEPACITHASICVCLRANANANASVCECACVCECVFHQCTH